MRTQHTVLASVETIERFRDRAGATHRVIVRSVRGGWQIVDIATRLLDKLDHQHDDRNAAEAIAHEFAQEHRWPPQR